MARRMLGAALAVALLSLTSGCSVSSPRREVAGAVVESGSGVPSSDENAGAVGQDLATASADAGGSTPANVATSRSARRAATTSSGGAQAPNEPSSTENGGDGARAGAAVPTASATGVSSDSVTVSIIAGFTGPLAPVIERAYDGFLTWQDDVNAGGGIHGRKVVLKRVDHKETPEGGVAACREALSNGSFVAMVPEGIEATLNAIGCLDAAGMPTVYYSGTTDPKWKYAFADIITSADGGHVMASYVGDRLGGTSKKVGVLYVNQLSYKAFADTFVSSAKERGVKVALVEAVEPNQASFTSNLLHMREAGVEVLVISATTDAVGIIRDAKSINYAPTFSGWGFQFDFLTTGARNMFQGVTGLRTYATVDSEAYKKYAARMEARGRGRDRASDLEGLPTYGHALVLGELMQRAGANPTRESFVAGAETVKNYDNGILPPITWGPDQHIGVRSAFPTVCCNEDWTWKWQGPARAEFV